MEEHTASRKRARASDLQDATQPDAGPQPRGGDSAAVRDRDYWFEDGNIVLIARGVSFRVYKGLLAEHSSVFRSMFLVAQASPQPAEQSIDGCPVVYLDDAPEDLRQLFKFIFPLGTSIRLNQGPTINIDMLAALIRLDHKYELPSLHEQAISFLSKYYTTDFDAWVDGTNATHWRPQPIHAIVAIGIARLTNTLSILPAAFYQLATLPLEELLAGYAAPAGESGSMPTMTWRRLPQAELLLCLELRDALIALNIETAFSLFKAPTSPPSCTTRGHCAMYFRQLLEYASQGELPHTLASSRALDSWLPNLEQEHAPLVFKHRSACRNCRSEFASREREMRRETWRKLPGLLGLIIGGWDEGAADA
ncbi:hypothetical protein ONZ51_g164 [Trametes cubensis]|uniref:BTB domain-containing protein n=1 Tax=Trametes cubensis TaxID=1111947 RepID=A0AAD7U6A3_9APHY|nr:hypothetical protein ONZ51_g164 [Trametes cubensis]